MLEFVELEEIEKSRALTATALEYERRFLDRCRAICSTTVYPELAPPGFRPGLIGPTR